jgi:hypothetical protein
MRKLATPLSCLLVLALSSAPLHANPSTSATELPLAIRNEEINRDLLDQLIPIDRWTARKLAVLEDKQAKDELTAGDYVAVSDVAVAVLYQNDLGERLFNRGEACGADFTRRSAAYETRRVRLTDAIKADSQFSAAGIEQTLKRLHAQALARLPELAKAGPMDLERVEKELLQMQAELHRHAIWLQDSARYTAPVREALSAVRGTLSQARAEALRAELTAILAGQELQAAEILEQIAAATREVQRVGAAPWQGKSYTGPQLVGAIVRQWQQFHQRALRRRALILAGGDNLGQSPASGEEVQQADRDFAGSIRSALADLIEADATRVEPARASALYQEYVQALGEAALVSDREALLAGTEPALLQLAGKDPLLLPEVKAYSASTTEILRWRRRIAQAQGVQRQSAAAPPLPAKFADAVRNRPFDPALLEDRAPSDLAALGAPAPNVMRRLSQEMVGRIYTVTDVFGLGGGKAMGRYTARTYARLSFPHSPEYEAEVAALRRQLLVKEDYPPLSLHAAATLAAAEGECFERVGGSVQQVHLEPVLTRFASLSDRSTGFTRADHMPTEPSVDLRAHVLARFDVLPHWVQHECFLVVLFEPPPPQE